MPDAQREAVSPPGHGVRAWVAWWALLAGLYLLLVDNAPLPELAMAALAGAIGASGAVLVRRQRERVLRPRARWLLAAWRPLLGLATDVVPLVRALVLRGILRRPGTGALLELPFDAGDEDDPRDEAYRVLTQALGSLAPNTLVVDVDARRGVLIAHQLVPTADPARTAAPLGPR